MVRILFVCPQHGSSGNFTTVTRISSHLSSFGHHVDIRSIDDVMRQNSEVKSYAVAFTIHAYKSASLLRIIGKETKLFLLFGGTDLNENLLCDDKREVMGQVLVRCSHCIAFSETMKKLACTAWPEFANKISTIHQGVITCPSDTFDLREYLLSTCSYSAQSAILVLVSGIRPVKDPLFLLQAFAESKLSKTMSFIIIGPVSPSLFLLRGKRRQLKIDEGYGQEFLSQVTKYSESNVVYAGELSAPHTHAAIKQSNCLINSSLSEGMCASILEAFDLSTPVIARRIPGNEYLVEHNVNGLLYRTPQEFVESVHMMMSSDMKERLPLRAKERLNDSFSADKERELYGKVMGML